MTAAVKLTADQRSAFKAKVAESAVSSCWNWQSAIDRNGYGQFMVHPFGVKLAHRIAYLLHKGEIPLGLWVLHTCDNRRCVNPQHLYAGTPLDNARDRDVQGNRKAPAGTLNGNAVFSDEQVLEIRAVHASKKKFKPTLLTLADKYGVSLGAIKKIVYNENWKHI